jgi:hypothetical protein
MQSWQTVKVTNNESLHAGRVGSVVRVEKKGDVRFAQVRLDEQGEVGTPGHLASEMEPFAEDELQVLG